MTARPIDLDAAMAVFAHGFAYTRSRTHPYLAERRGALWVLRDGPRRHGNARTEEWLAPGGDPAQVVAQVLAEARGRHALCVLHPQPTSHDALRDAYKAHGCRLLRTEPLMVHELRELPDFAAPPGIGVERVTTVELAERLRRAAGQTQIAPADLPDTSPHRQWLALDGDVPVGWVGSVQTAAGAWCSNLYVLPDWRRRGIGRALMSALLADDRARGAALAVLLASHAGARLYPVVGYRQVGTLLVMSPTGRAGA
jgi:GNAT superfamily N-acetyltransferase